jgi:alkylated DNA repair dioxygenase AlkB
LGGFRKKLSTANPFTHLKGWLKSPEADSLLHQLEARSDWTQGSVRMFGRIVPEPRLSIFEGDHGISYSYAQRRLEGLGWTPELAELRDRFQRELGIANNSVLMNLYRDGQDSMGWHRDNEPELGHDPLVVSLSLGATRDFDVRRDTDRWTQRFALGHGDLLLMGRESQTKWMHCLPKRLRVGDLRINLTFRQVLS